MPNGEQNPIDDFRKIFNAFPEVVQNYFYSDESDNVMVGLAKKFHLSEDQKDALNGIVGDLFIKDLDFDGLPAAIESETGLLKDKSKELALELLGNYFLPLNDFYGGEVEKTIKVLGGKIKDYPELRVMVKKESAGSAADEVAKEFLPLFPDEVLRHRFIELVDSRLREVRKESDLREILMRSSKVGGLGLDEETSQKIIDAAAEKMRSVKIVADATISDQLSAVSNQLPVVGNAGKPEVRSPKSEVDKAVEPPKPVPVAKPEPVKSAPPPPPVVKPEPPKPVVAPIIEKKSEEKIPPLNLRGAGGVKRQDTTPLHPPLVRGGDEGAPFQKVENISEIRENPRNRKSDVSDAELEREIQHIKHDIMPKAELPPFDFAAIAARIAAESRINLGNEQLGRLKIILTARLKDIRDSAETKEIFSRDYALGGMGFSDGQIQALSPILEGEFKKIEERQKSEAEENIAVSRRGDEERRQKVAAEARASEQAGLDARFRAIASKSKRPVESSRERGDTPAFAGSPRPKLQDVKYESKLVGPIDEIKRLTLTDFRRLAATPKETVIKIKDKIEALKANSIKKWQEGIAAWSNGEVNKLYLQIFAEALRKKKSLKEISAERVAAAAPTLSQDEINAIMELNKSLRF